MPSPSREFHLIVDRATSLSEGGSQVGDPGGVTGGASDATLGDATPRLIVPAGVSYLLASTCKTPRLLEEADRDEADRAFLLEPVVSQTQPYLVLIAQPGQEVRVNGQSAPRFATLREKDQIQFDDEFLLHLALFSRPRIASVAATSVGKECPTCRVPFLAGVRVLECANCGSPMHLQGDEEPASTRLECALAVSQCPVCQTTIEMTEGYRNEPELYNA